MTNEQWLVYLYSIYPDGGWTFLWWMVLLATVVFLGFSFLSYSESNYVRGCTKEETVYFNHKSTMFKLIASLSMLIFLSNLVPDKKYLLAITVTPSIIDSYSKEGGKLHTLDSIIDKVLIKADKYLKDKEDKED